MQVESLALPEVKVLRPRVYGDARGRFVETWNAARWAEAGLPSAWVQDNVSFSHAGVLRGLHCQQPFAQGKLVTVLRGRAFDAIVDARVGSPDFGRWVGFELDAESLAQLYVPPGFLHGFVALEDDTIFSYKCSERYEPSAEFSVRWDDPAIGIAWPVATPTLAAKDAAAPLLAEVPEARLPRYVRAAAP